MGRNAVIAVIILIILVTLLFKIMTSASKNVDEKTCQSSIEAHILTMKSSEGRSAPDIDCPTKYKNITEKDETAIKYALAEEMRKAWKLWKKGEENVFGGEEGIFCHIYSILEFENKNLEIEEFDEYLLLTNIPSGEMTYQKFFTPFMTEDVEGIEEVVEKFEEERKAHNINKPKIYTSQQYMVIFRVAKGKDKMMIFSNIQEETAAGVVMGILRGAAAGAATGATYGLACTIAGPGGLICSVGGAVLGTLVGGATGIITYYSYDGSDPQDYAASIALLPYRADVIQNMNCEYTPIGGSEVVRS